MGVMTNDADVPVTGDPHFKFMPCRYCGKPIKVSRQRRKLPSHVECGIGVAVENARQIQEKKGPAYDRWLSGQTRYLKNLTRGGDASNGGG